MDELKEISQKLDMIIRFFNIDGKQKSPTSIRREIDEKVVKLLERRRKRNGE